MLYIEMFHDFLQAIFKPRDALMHRANSLKKAIRQIIEHTEKGTYTLFDQITAHTLIILNL